MAGCAGGAPGRAAACGGAPAHRARCLACLALLLLQGAARIYVEGLRPWLLRWQPALDGFCAAVLTSLVRRGRVARLQPPAALACGSRLGEPRRLSTQPLPPPPLPAPIWQRRPELAVCGEALHHFLSRTPVLEWLVRGPDGRPAPRSGGAFITDGGDAR